MATPRKKPVKRVVKKKTQDAGTYTRLEEYCIWLNEYYRALKNAGFNDDMSFWLISAKESYPDWVNFRIPTNEDIAKHLEDEEDE